MSKLTELALAGYQLEKNAGLVDGVKKVGKAIRDFPGRAVHILDTNKTAREAFSMGIGGGSAVGYMAGVHRGKKSVEKKASLLDVAKGIASVGKNAIKQNPSVAKAALGGAVAGAAVAKAGQTKQAEAGKAFVSLPNQKPYGALRHIRDAAFTAVDAYAGKAAGGMVAAATSPHQIGGHLHTGRVGFGKGLGMAAGAAIGVANSVGRRETHEKYAAAADKALQKEEKDNGGPVNVTGGGTVLKAKSSLVASAKAEMAKAASKK